LQGPPAHPNCRCWMNTSTQITKSIKYDPDQPRDEQGRWSEEGGGGSESLRELPNNYEEANPIMRDEFQEWRNNLTYAEEKALARYIGSDYEDINTLLRTGEYTSWEREKIDAYIKNLNNALDKSPGLSEATMLYRGISSEEIYSALENGQIEIGSTFIDKGFVSTTVTAGRTDYFAKGKYPIKLEIQAAKGARGAFISFDDISPLTTYESEFLVPPNSSMIITDTGIKDGIGYIRLEY